MGVFQSFRFDGDRLCIYAAAVQISGHSSSGRLAPSRISRAFDCKILPYRSAVPLGSLVYVGAVSSTIPSSLVQFSNGVFFSLSLEMNPLSLSIRILQSLRPNCLVMKASKSTSMSKASGLCCKV